MSRHGASDKIKKSLMLLSVIAFHSMLHIYPSLARSLGFLEPRFSRVGPYTRNTEPNNLQPIPFHIPGLLRLVLLLRMSLVLLPFPKP